METSEPGEKDYHTNWLWFHFFIGLKLRYKSEKLRKCKFYGSFETLSPPFLDKKVLKLHLDLLYLKCPWNDSSKTPLDCSFLITRMQFRDISKKLFWRIIKIILEGKIHFERFPSLSCFPSQGHNSFNIESKSTSRTIFGN